MIDLAAQLVVLAFQLATIAAVAFAITFCVAVVMGERERVRLRRRGRRAAKAYGLHLVPRDEVADARARRRDRGTAA